MATPETVEAVQSALTQRLNETLGSDLPNDYCKGEALVAIKADRKALTEQSAVILTRDDIRKGLEAIVDSYQRIDWINDRVIDTFIAQKSQWSED